MESTVTASALCACGGCHHDRGYDNLTAPRRCRWRPTTSLRSAVCSRDVP